MKFCSITQGDSFPFFNYKTEILTLNSACHKSTNRADSNYFIYCQRYRRKTIRKNCLEYFFYIHKPNFITNIFNSFIILEDLNIWIHKTIKWSNYPVFTFHRALDINLKSKLIIFKFWVKTKIMKNMRILSWKSQYAYKKLSIDRYNLMSDHNVSHINISNFCLSHFLIGQLQNKQFAIIN